MLAEIDGGGRLLTKAFMINLWGEWLGKPTNGNTKTPTLGGEI